MSYRGHRCVALHDESRSLPVFVQDFLSDKMIAPAAPVPVVLRQTSGQPCRICQDQEAGQDNETDSFEVVVPIDEESPQTQVETECSHRRQANQRYEVHQQVELDSCFRFQDPCQDGRLFFLQTGFTTAQVTCLGAAGREPREETRPMHVSDGSATLARTDEWLSQKSFSSRETYSAGLVTIFPERTHGRECSDNRTSDGEKREFVWLRRALQSF